MKTFFAIDDLISLLTDVDGFKQEAGVYTSLKFSPTKFQTCPLLTLVKGIRNKKGLRQSAWWMTSGQYAFLPHAIIGTCLHKLHEDDSTSGKQTPSEELHYWAQEELNRESSVEELFRHKNLMYRISQYQHHYRAWFKKGDSPNHRSEQDDSNQSTGNNTPPKLESGTEKILWAIVDGLYLFGKVDKIDIKGAEITIEDLKTGKVGQTKSDFFALKDQYVLQLIWYGYSASQMAILDGISKPKMVLSLKDSKQHILSSERQTDDKHNMYFVRAESEFAFTTKKMTEFFDEHIKVVLQKVSTFLGGQENRDITEITNPGDSCIYCSIRQSCKPYHTHMEEHRKDVLAYAVPQDIWGVITRIDKTGEAQVAVIDVNGLEYSISNISSEISLTVGSILYAYRLKNNYRIYRHVYRNLVYVEDSIAEVVDY
jgi:hypothetical protein